MNTFDFDHDRTSRAQRAHDSTAARRAAPSSSVRSSITISSCGGSRRADRGGPRQQTRRCAVRCCPRDRSTRSQRTAGLRRESELEPWRFSSEGSNQTAKVRSQLRGSVFSRPLQFATGEAGRRCAASPPIKPDCGCRRRAAAPERVELRGAPFSLPADLQSCSRGFGSPAEFVIVAVCERLSGREKPRPFRLAALRVFERIGAKPPSEAIPELGKLREDVAALVFRFRLLRLRRLLRPELNAQDPLEKVGSPSMIVGEITGTSVRGGVSV